MKSVDAWFDDSKPWEAGFISTMRAIAARTPELAPPEKPCCPHRSVFG